MPDSQLYHCAVRDGTSKRHLHWIGCAHNEFQARLLANRVLHVDPRNLEVNRLTEAGEVVHVQLWMGNGRG